MVLPTISYLRSAIAIVGLAGAMAVTLIIQRLDADRDQWRALTASITEAIGDAAGNGSLKPRDAARQALALGQGIRTATAALERQTAAVRALEAKAIENRERGERYRRQLAAAQAQRAHLITRFEQAAGDDARRDCVAELSKMDDLINALRASGF